MGIPKLIANKAAELGYDSVEYIGKRNGADAFVFGHDTKDGIPFPTGLPTVYLLKENALKVVHGLEALDLL